MGSPSQEEGAILKKGYWRKWPKGKKLPAPIFTFACADTAFEDGETNDYSAVTVWHVFETVDQGRDHREYNHHHAMLAASWFDKVDAVDLEAKMEEITADFDGQIDLWLVEKRASGIQLIQEMRRRRFNVKAWLPPGPKQAKGKLPRAYAAQLVFHQGGVWYIDAAWSREVIDICARFPYGDNLDIPDTVTMAIIFLRRHFWMGLPIDEETQEEETLRMGKELARKPRRLYGSGARPANARKFDVSRRKLYG
jgi:phage terminase large subunit-like protein